MATVGTSQRQAKLVLLGDMGAGKSSLVLRFTKGQFFDYQESTIGAAFLTQTLAVNDTTIKFEIWDTAGQERYHSLAPMYYRGAAAAIIVYDISNVESFVRAKNRVAKLQSQGNSNLVMALAGNKADLEAKRSVSKEDAQVSADENGLFFMETSAKTAQNVNELFYEIVKRLPKLQQGPKPAGISFSECSNSKGALELKDEELYRFCKKICDEEDDIYNAKGALELLGVELFRECEKDSDQQQDIGELVDKRVAATAFDPQSILTVMMRLALQVDKEDVVAFCLGRGVVVDYLHMVAVAEWLSFASHRKMIEAKAVDIHCLAGWHGDILSVAVNNKNLEWTQFCLKNGACPNISRVHGYKFVIARAAEEGFHAMVELLLAFGAKLQGSGAIVLAAAAGQTEMVRWLLVKGADVNEVGVESPHSSNLDVGTPLHRAISNGHKETAKLLIENGANLSLKDWQGRTPVKLAKQVRPNWLSKRGLPSKSAS